MREGGAAYDAVTGPHRLLAVMDFDGTITAGDCMDELLERHVAAWPSLKEAVRSAGLPETAAIEEAVGLLRIPRRRALAEFARYAVLRPGFHRFLEGLLDAGGRAAVVSVGFREGIEAVWRREQLPAVPFYAAELLGDTPSGYALGLHGAYGDCPVCGPARCKGPVVRSLRREDELVVAFGDGSRDLCMAREAAAVFARGRLARLCEREGIPWHRLDDFEAMPHRLAVVLDERTCR
jgi:2-hydroxy-3-keto-5-methylthiopentenyl-1-phosphate phosphatase